MNERSVRPLRPALVDALRGYTWRIAASDVAAGVTVGLVALPLAMAFAISSGMPPQAGLYTAIVAGALISLLGGSRVQIGGPTGAFVVIVAGIVATYGVDGLLVCTLMAGAMLVALGLTGLGSAIRYIPRPVVVGFTNGIAVLIASTQIRDFFGIRMPSPSSDFVPRMRELAAHAGAWSPQATALSIATLATVIVVMRLSKRVPGSIVALCLGTLAVPLLHLSVETIGSRFGGIPRGLPAPHLPHLSLTLMRGLIVPAFTVAMLGAIESLLSATVADRMSGDRHDPNVELVAQGIANLASPLVGGLPATGAIARTATNIRSGAKTPISGVMHALTLLAVLLVAAPLAAAIPLAVLAAILIVVSYNMGEWGEIPEILRLAKADIAVWFATFALTVFADLTIAVGVGMVLAALLFILRVAETTTVAAVTDDYLRDARPHSLHGKAIPDYVAVFRVHGPLLFGTGDKLWPIMERAADLPPIVVLRLRDMTAIDATGVRAIEELALALEGTGRRLILCGARHQPARVLARAAVHRHIGDGNVRANFHDALHRAAELHDLDAIESARTRRATA